MRRMQFGYGPLRQYARYGARWIRGAGALPPRRRVVRHRQRTFGAKVRRIIDKYKEPKLIDVDIFTSTPIVGTSLIIYLSGIALGDDEELRDGNLIHITGYDLHMNITTDVNAVVDTVCRVVLFCVKKNQEGGLPTVTEILEADTTEAHRQHDGVRDYRILFDNRFLIKLPGFSGTQSLKLLDRKKVFKVPLKTTYDGDTATITDCERNGIFILLMTNQASTFQPTFDGNLRIKFKDA